MSGWIRVVNYFKVYAFSLSLSLISVRGEGSKEASVGFC
jgi:hypothetical protein